MTVILSGAKRSRSYNAAEVVGEAELSIPRQYLEALAMRFLVPSHTGIFAQDDK